ASLRTRGRHGSGPRHRNGSALRTILAGAKEDATSKSGGGAGRERDVKDRARTPVQNERQPGTADGKLWKTGSHALNRRALPAIVGHHQRCTTRRVDRDRTKI